MTNDKIVIFVRHTEDWNSDTIPSKFGVSLKGWNFRLAYGEFRRCLKEIAQKTWLTVSPNIQYGKLKVEDDQIVVPTDDDDWFSPDLRDFLLSRDEAYLRWRSVCHQVQGGHKMYIRHGRVGSNEYAVRGWLAKKKPRILHDHGGSESMATECCGTQDLLACYNWHLGSASLLTHADPKCPEWRSDFPLLDEQPWMIPHFKQFGCVLQRLQHLPLPLL